MKSRIFLIIGLSCLIVVMAYSLRSKEKCNCVKYLKTSTVIIHNDATFEKQIDSICVAGESDGKMFVKTIENPKK